MGKRETMFQWLSPGKGRKLPLTTPQLLCSLCQLVQCPHQPGWNSPVLWVSAPTMNGHRVQVL